MRRQQRTLSRRQFCALSATAAASVAAVTSCRALAGPGDGRIEARPPAGVKTSVSGRLQLGLNTDRDAILQLPSKAAESLPLLVMLHGATQSADDMFWYLGSVPEEAGVAVLAPNSRGTTWDAIEGAFGAVGGGFGVDVALLNQALERTFQLVAVDPARVLLAGFSDGATYAISLGLINGDFFNRVIGFSAGFVIEGIPHGQPRFFMSHGTHDHILPIERCGRLVAAQLISRGYNVTFREFEGDHEIPADVAREALRWASSSQR